MRKDIDILKEELEEAIDFQKTEDQELAEFFNDCLEWIIFLQTSFNFLEHKKEFEAQQYEALLKKALKRLEYLEEIQDENQYLKDMLKDYTDGMM